MYWKKSSYARKGLSPTNIFPPCYAPHSKHSVIVTNRNTNNDNRDRNAGRYMHQSVTITGLDEPLFAKAIENLAKIQSMFDRHVDKTDFERWIPSTYTTYPAIELKNRYFTYRNDDPQGPSVPLGENVDPTGRLAALAGTDLFHSEDNVVIYRAKLASSTQ